MKIGAYASGLWICDGNRKRSVEHYFFYLDQTIEMIPGAQLTFLSNSEEVLDRVHRACGRWGVSLRAEVRQIAELPAYATAGHYMDSCRRMALDVGGEFEEKRGEKGVIHYWRDYLKGSPALYREMLAIWASKIRLTVAMNSALGMENFAWIDASVSRFSRKRRNWDFHGMDFPAESISHYSSMARHYGRKLPINASVLAGNIEKWKSLDAVFYRYFDKLHLMPYAHDEETVLSYCQRDFPDLFSSIDERAGCRAWLARLGLR